MGTSIADSSGSGNTGTLFGNSLTNPVFEILNSQWGGGSENLVFDTMHSKTWTYSGRILKLDAGELVSLAAIT